MSHDEPSESDDIIQNNAHGRQFSTPALSDDSTHKELRELIGELGTQIGESIASRLLSSQVPLGPNQTAPTESPKVKGPDTTLDFSKMNLVVRQDIKDPPMYRGDDADKYSVHEWIDMMEVYLQKRGLSGAMQVDEILNHLLGRAKNIVRVGLKSNSSSGAVTNPETIYAILRRYFSESPGSCQPLADFYATQPVAKETPVDYWVRLNITAEAADRHLQRQGGKMENMEAEIAMMFIRNCPDPSLACVFKCSMACTLSEEAEQELKSAGVALELSDIRTDIMLVGCGGVQVKPKCICELEMEVYDCTFRVPALVVPGQKDQLILGTNVIKHLLRHFRLSPHFWQVLSKPESAEAPEIVQFLNMLSGINRWRGDKMPDVIGTVKLAQAVTLLPKQEHLVWGRLPASSPLSEGSAILIEPPKSQTHKKGVIVCRTVVSMSGDRWVPVRILNTCDKPITLRRNTKVADASTCVAVEDLEVASDQNPGETLKVQSQTVCSDTHSSSPSCSSFRDSLQKVGLEDLDLDSCEVSDHWKAQVLQLIHRYEDVFSKSKLDCGLAKDFVHRIHLSDDRPFRLPYRRVPPGQYHKLRQVLTEMEERELIRKSNSEWASPLVLVWKKNGDLRICVDYHWLNARTIKDAHPLPHQSDCLAALGGNAIFSAMDLTSGFYNIVMAEEDKKLTAFTTPMGLYEFNRLPQGLCNSPASFMRLMMGIFGDQNFLTLLCYLDDLLVYAPSEAEALRRLEIVFSRLRAHGLKLAPKKCHLFRRSVRFLGHVVTEGGVSTDPDKVKAITAISEGDLMMEDGVTPSQKRIKSFLGMVMYYQHFIQDCSKIARPLFTLTAAPKGKKVNARGAASFRRLSPSDWRKEHVDSFEHLKAALLGSVVLAHPDFNKPFILSTDASQDGLGAVLSQVQEGESKARPVAFASKALTRAQRNYPAHRLEFLALKWSVCDKFSHWLKGHSFTVWTDNNPLTYILTKPKLDACEQRWVSKLSPYNFSIKYIPGSKNVVADALSRQPFIHNCVSQRLMSEPYATLLEESQQVKEISSVECLAPAESLGCCSLTNDEVSAVFTGHTEWDEGPKQRAISWLSQELDRLPSLGQNTLSAFSLQELQEEQRADVTLSQVIPFAIRGRRPSRRERAHLSHKAQKTMKQWEKLKMLDGILYRVSKDPLTVKSCQVSMMMLAIRVKAELCI
ncbi:hypothetical protein ACER0C_001809 [Sarotherodon galilaeus]